jgi:hypothetical protein
MGALVSCSKFSLDTQWRSGKYVLIAIDTRGQMSLTIDGQSGMSSALVGPTVFSIGADDRYIVVKQHPSTDAYGGFDRSVTNYFIVDRAVSSGPADGQKAIRGPMGENEFKTFSATLALPAFAKTFDDLK